MAIFLTADSKIIVQGITGADGTKHTRRMVASGSKVVGGVNPRKAGTDVDGIAVYATVAEAMAGTGADVSVVFVPPAFAKAAVIEAIDAAMPLVVIITEGIPVQDSAWFWEYSQGRSTRIIGPNCPGLISPGKSNAGIIPASIAPDAGRIGFRGQETIRMRPDEVARAGIALCPEERGIFASLNVTENLMLPPQIAPGGMSVAEIHTLFPNLKERASSQGTKLSGGEQQMLAIGRILRTGARLLLLDEPTAPSGRSRRAATPCCWWSRTSASPRPSPTGTTSWSTGASLT